MPKKRKVPVIRAWRCPSVPTWRALLVGKALYAKWPKWPKSGQRQWVRLKTVVGGVASVLALYGVGRGYIELPPTEARRLNQQRLKAMKGRKP